jgi:hypothetical protein
MKCHCDRVFSIFLSFLLLILFPHYSTLLYHHPHCIGIELNTKLLYQILVLQAGGFIFELPLAG